MSTRHLDALLRPKAIALIGASARPGSVGAQVLRNLLGAGFEGAILPVNPTRGVVQGIVSYPDVDALPLVPDLAVIATPPTAVAATLDRLGARGFAYFAHDHEHGMNSVTDGRPSSRCTCSKSGCTRSESGLIGAGDNRWRTSSAARSASRSKR